LDGLYTALAVKAVEEVMALLGGGWPQCQQRRNVHQHNKKKKLF